MKMHVDGTACLDVTDGLVVKSTMKISMGVSSTEEGEAMSIDMGGTLRPARISCHALLRARSWEVHAGR